jgi:subtilisin
MKKVFAWLTLSAICAAVVLPSLVRGQNSSRRPASDAPRQQAASPRADFAPGEYFVAFSGEVGASDVAAVRSQGASVHAQFPEVRALAVRVNNPRQLEALERHPRVEYVEPVPMRYPTGLADGELTPSPANGLYGLLTTKAADAHARGVTGSGINVGVADTGIDYTHPDIAPNYRGGVDTVGAGDGNPFSDDGETHGTHVAGTIAAALNKTGVRGVAYGANLYHARVLGPDGGTATDIMEGVRWLVVQAGCKVVNLSLGGSFSSRTGEKF